VFSTLVHYAVSPWSLFPEKKLELREVDGELTIAIDSIEEAPTPPPPEPPPPPPEIPAAEGIGSTKRDAGPKPKEKDAGRDGALDAAGDALAEDGAVPLAMALDGGESSLDGAVALNDDGGTTPPGANGPRNPSEFIGSAGDIQPGIPNVQIFVNVAEVRKSAIAPQVSKFFALIPEWDSFIAGTNVDPIRDADWFYLFGPSLYTKRSSKVALFIRYSVSDAVVDRAVEIVSKKYASGGPIDAGVPGVKAYLGHADYAPRVFLRPQPHFLAVVPPDYATAFAKVLKKGRFDKKGRAGEVARISVRDPGRPMPFLPETLKELRLWGTPREDGGIEIFGEADAPDAAAAVAAADQVKKLVRSYARSALVRMVTDALDTVEVTADGSMVRIHAPVTGKQMTDIVTFASGFLGVDKH
jgi:hypothetical protein